MNAAAKAFIPVLLLGIVLAGCVQQNAGSQDANQTALQAAPSLTDAEEELLKYPELAAYIQNYQQGAAVGAQSKRPDYLPSIVFSKLPPMPKDFYVVDLLVDKGIFTDVNRIEEAYWKQPEFYPTFEDQGVELYQHPPQGRWAAFGVGSYPSELIVLSPRNNQFEVAFMMYTSWLVETYQGTKFNYGFPKSGNILLSDFPDGSRDVIQDPAVVKEYFDVEITPNEILLEPAFPLFEKNWVQKIKVKVKVKDAPPGKYLIGVGSEAPSKEKADEWLWKYKNRYTDAAVSYGGIGRPWFSIFIDIQ